MARRRQNGGGNASGDAARLILGIAALIALTVGGVGKFLAVFTGLLQFLFFSVVVLLVVALALGIGYGVLRRCFRREPPAPLPPGNRFVPPAARPTPTAVRRNVVLPESVTPNPINAPSRNGLSPRPVPPPRPEPPAWTPALIEQALGEIDWYQFEKFSAALLASDGFQVERRGGARPDGGVDLIATKDSTPMLVQCKHWRTWTLQERVIREMLGSMSHFGVRRGAIYTLKGWSKSAADFADQHEIILMNSVSLAALASRQLTTSRLDELLKSRNHHCPKCESIMVWRVGNFPPFWGCPKFPRCRGKLNHSGAR